MLDNNCKMITDVVLRWIWPCSAPPGQVTQYLHQGIKKRAQVTEIELSEPKLGRIIAQCFAGGNSSLFSSAYSHPQSYDHCIVMDVSISPENVNFLHSNHSLT